MLVICRKRDAIDMVATPSGLVMMITVMMITVMMITVMMITVMMMMLVFRWKRAAIDILAGA